VEKTRYLAPDGRAKDIFEALSHDCFVAASEMDDGVAALNGGRNAFRIAEVASEEIKGKARNAPGASCCVNQGARGKGAGPYHHFAEAAADQAGSTSDQDPHGSGGSCCGFLAIHS
jgi:hypothetical protein